MLLVNACHSPVREDMWITGFFLNVEVQAEAKKMHKGQHSHFGSLVYPHSELTCQVLSADWALGLSRVAKEIIKTCWAIFCKLALLCYSHTYCFSNIPKTHISLSSGKKTNTLYIFLQAKTIWSGGTRCQAASARISHNKLPKRQALRVSLTDML